MTSTAVAAAPHIGTALTETPSSERPHYTRRDVPQSARVLADGIEDLNADALDAVCIKCRSALSWGQWLNASYRHNRPTNCHRCGHNIFAGDFTKEPLPLHQLEKFAAPDYLDRTWYHATRQEHWAEEVASAERGQLLVHAGSYLAALSRANDLRREYNKGWEPIFVHSFQIQDTENFATEIVDDTMDDWPERLDDAAYHAMPICPIEGEVESFNDVGSYEDICESYDESNFIHLRDGLRGAAYYNRYELPGDLSLIFQATMIQQSTVETVEM